MWARAPTARRRSAFVAAAIGCGLWWSTVAVASPAPVADFNGDGLADVVLAHRAAPSDPTGNFLPDSVVVVFGDRQPASLNRAALPPERGFTIRTGFTVYGHQPIGDANGDGLTDLLVRTGPWAGADAGSSGTFLVHGRRAGSDINLDRPAPGVQRVPPNVLRRVEIADVNGDGVTDVVLIRRASPRGLKVFFGRHNHRVELSAALHRTARAGLDIRVSFPGGQGLSLLRAGDANGDGINDVAFKVDGYYDCGEIVGPCGGPAFLLVGRRKPTEVDLTRDGSSGFRVRARGQRRPAGYVISDDVDGLFGSPGDFDGDGFDDLLTVDAHASIVHGQRPRQRRGAAVYRRPAFTSIPGLTSDAGTVAPLGDVNGDGLADVLVTVAPYYGPDPSVAVVLGRRSRTPTSESPLGSLGWPIALPPDAPFFGAPLGDTNGDGLADFAIHTYTGRPGPTYVVLGTRSTAPLRLPPFDSSAFMID